jgi:hypothetical protein
MKPKTIQSFLRWTIFIFILFAVTKKIELQLARAVGSHLSAEYAQWITDLHKSADAIRTKDPDGWQYVTSRVGFATYGLYAVASAIIAGFIVWWRRDSRGMPNNSLQATAAAPSSRD